MVTSTPCRRRLPRSVPRFVPRLLPLSLALAATLALAPRSGAQPPAGSELQVNGLTTGSQDFPDVARTADGGFVVVWSSLASAGSDSDGRSIQMRRFTAEGTPLGNDFQVNTLTADAQNRPAVAAGAGGGFVVVWESYGVPDGSGVRARRFDAAGAPLGGELQVETATAGYQRLPDVAALAGGGFVVVWQSDAAVGDASSTGIGARRFDAAGAPLGTETRVNDTTGGAQLEPAVDAAGSGFVVVWQESYAEVRARRFDAAGTPLGGELDVTTTPGGRSPAVAAAPSGDFVAVWHGGSGSYHVRGQRFAADGTSAGSEFQVDGATTGDASQAVVAVDAGGDFVVAWQSRGAAAANAAAANAAAAADADGDSVRGRRFEADGTALGDEFQVNGTTTGDQGYPALARAAGGDFVVVWASDVSPGTDDGPSVLAQRYAAPLVPGPTDLAIVQGDAPDPVQVGQALAYTVTVTNLGPAPAADVTVVDTLPAGVGFVAAGGQDWSCGEAAGVVTCTRPSLGLGPAPAITVALSAPGAATTLTNHAAVSAADSDPEPANDETFETTTVAVATADLGLTLADAPDPVASGAAVTATVTVSNAGPSTANDLVLSFELDASAAFLSAAGTGWSCGESAGTVTCTRAALGVGGMTSVQVVMGAPVVVVDGTLDHAAEVVAATPDPDPGDNGATATTTVLAAVDEADLSLTLVDSPDPVGPGSSLLYTLSVANAGPSTATGVSVVLDLPAATTFVSAQGSGWSCGESLGDVTCGRASLGIATAPAIAVRVIPTEIGTRTAHAAVTSNETDPTPADAAAAASTRVEESVFADGFETGDTTRWSRRLP